MKWLRPIPKDYILILCTHRPVRCENPCAFAHVFTYYKTFSFSFKDILIIINNEKSVIWYNSSI